MVLNQLARKCVNSFILRCVCVHAIDYQRVSRLSETLLHYHLTASYKPVCFTSQWKICRGVAQETSERRPR